MEMGVKLQMEMGMEKKAFVRKPSLIALASPNLGVQSRTIEVVECPMLVVAEVFVNPMIIVGVFDCPILPARDFDNPMLAAEAFDCPIVAIMAIGSPIVEHFVEAINNPKLAVSFKGLRNHMG